jgi:hypothetical protein
VSSKDAKLALRLIATVLSNPRLKPDDGDQLRRTRRELMALARSGKIERRKLFRIVRIISQILQKLL